MTQIPDAITANAMREIELEAINAGDVTGAELMERAGEGACDAILSYWPELAAGVHTAVVLCGPGNNGGDGFVIARLLKERGWMVSVYAVGWDLLWEPGADRPNAPPDARKNAERWAAIGGLTRPLDALTGDALCAKGIVLVVDALLGIGQTRDPSALLRPFWRTWDDKMDASPRNEVLCVSVDVPTGYDTDTGALLSAMPFEPDLTVTFHAAKPVHDLAECGDIAIVDIGL